MALKKLEPKTKMLSKKLEGKNVKCLACHRYCTIPDGNAGFCGVRMNEGGKLRLSVYGKPAAVWVDPIEKKPFFHFLSGSTSYSIGTFGCNFACSFCQNWDISQAPQEARVREPAKWKDYFTKLVDSCPELPPEQAVENALASRSKSISFTYNEPTIFTEYAIDTMKLAHKKGLKGTYVTNGYESHECWDAITGLIDAANIDLKAYNQRFYTELAKVPHYEYVKDSIEYAKKKGIWVETTTLIIPGWNDDLKELKAEAEFLASVDPEMPWHVTAFHPDYKMLDTEATPPEILVKAREIGKMAGLKYVYCGNVGFGYSDYEATDCPKCGKKIVSRMGFSVRESHVVKGRCQFCRTKISGVWE